MFNGSRTLENSDSRGKVVDTPGCSESGSDDGGGGDKIVGEAVVQVSLENCQLSALARSSPRAHPSCSNNADSGHGVVVEERT